MTNETAVVIPDIGITGEVTVIEIAVKVGDIIAVDQAIVTLEGEKASMEIPAAHGGKVTAIKIKVGDQVKTGSVILTVSGEQTTVIESNTAPSDHKMPDEVKSSTKTETATAVTSTSSSSPQSNEQQKELPNNQALDVKASDDTKVTTAAKSEKAPDAKANLYASPLVRRLARELTIDLAQITGTGHKNRLQKADLLQYISNAMKSGQQSNGATGLPQAPVIDFSQFGKITTQPLSKIKKYTAQNLHRNWLLIPHVTQFDEADITELEAFRKQQQQQNKLKLTPLVFIIKAAIATLKKFPAFNASLAPDGTELILKNYFHIGVAVDTPEGLVVPVIRDANQKSITELAAVLAELSAKARAKQLTPADMQGSSFTLSSLGGIGGTHFTPIVNLPNTAILGISKADIKPIYQNEQFVPRLMLPLSLSYDHRVIDGAEGARFIVQLAQYLTDIRLTLL